MGWRCRCSWRKYLFSKIRWWWTARRTNKSILDQLKIHTRLLSICYPRILANENSWTMHCTPFSDKTFNNVANDKEVTSIVSLFKSEALKLTLIFLYGQKVLCIIRYPDPDCWVLKEEWTSYTSFQEFGFIILSLVKFRLRDLVIKIHFFCHQNVLLWKDIYKDIFGLMESM